MLKLYSWTFLSVFWVMSLNLTADTPHRVLAEQTPRLILHYTLKDLGEIDLKPKDLTRQKDGLSLGPKINNRGDVIGNRSSGGFFILQNGNEYSPAIQGARFNLYSINNHNDALISISRGSSVDWFVWPTADGWDGRRLPIDPVELEGNKIFLSKINDQLKVVGIAKPDVKSMPLEWEPQKGLYRIGYSQNENLFGTVKDINNHNTIIGKSHRNLENFPYATINEQHLSLHKLRRKFQLPSDAKIVFADLVLNNHDHVFGTYWIDRHFDDPKAKKVRKFRAFKWVPAEDSLTLLDLDGMHISAMNNNDVIVGSHKGQASFREGDFKPVSIISTMEAKEAKGWHLLEATDINDEGQIVGYGTKEGKLHLFLASPRIDETVSHASMSKEVDDAKI